MFKNWFRSANEKRMEEQIVKLREDIVVLQTHISILEKQLEVNIIVKNVEELSDVLEPRESKDELPLPNNQQEEVIKKVLEEPVVAEDKVLEPVAVVEEKVLEPVVTVEKETNTVPPKKRRQSKKVAQLEEDLPKLIV